MRQDRSDDGHPSVPYDKTYAIDAPVEGTEMRARGTIFVAFREAVISLWGDRGIASVASGLPAIVRKETLESVVVSTEWVPEAHVLAWYEALWGGPCQRRTDLFCLVLDRMLDLGFGRVRRVFLSMANPATIFSRAPALWRYDHTHGHLTVEASPSAARLRLVEHPYTESPLSCLAVAEIYRYCTALTRVKSVQGSHFRDPNGGLVVRLRWVP